MRWSSACASSISAPANSMSAGMRERFSKRVGKTRVAKLVPPISTSYIVLPASGAKPSPLVALACGSMSINNTLSLPNAARQVERLIAVVVFPTPPFWLAMATIFIPNSRRPFSRQPSQKINLPTKK